MQELASPGSTESGGRYLFGGASDEKEPIWSEPRRSYRALR